MGKDGTIPPGQTPSLGQWSEKRTPREHRRSGPALADGTAYAKLSRVGQHGKLSAPLALAGV